MAREGEIDPRLREALEELDSYLADRIAPLLATDAIEVLIELPPDLTAQALHSWAAAQFNLRGGVEPFADLVFHALKKIQLFEEFNLLPAERFTAFLVAVANGLIGGCPPEDRERLEGMLRFLREGQQATVPTVEHLMRAPASISAAKAAPAATVPSPALSAEDLRNLRRFSLLLERSLSHGGEEPADDEVAQPLLVLAASGAASSEELESRLAQLRKRGIGPAVARDLVRSLSASVPDWVLQKERSVQVVRTGSVEAVRRIVHLAGDGARKSERWKDLLRAACDAFNEGTFGRAVTLLDLAEQMLRDGEVESHVAELARGSAHDWLDTAKVLEAAAEPSNRPILRRLAEFFPAWSVRELLDGLVFQPDKKKRRLLIVLLEVWGEEAHAPVLERLRVAVAEPSNDANAWWYLRNLVFLLHRLPRPAEVDPRDELTLVGPFSGLEHHPSFQRETMTLLAQLPNAVGAPLLVQRLGEIERALERGDTVTEPTELWKVLNSLAAALVKSGSAAARRALVEHALAQKPKCGDSMSRLRELAPVDLSPDRDVLARLLETAKSFQPVKLLGFLVSRNEEALVHVVRALASTTAPEARRVLRELAEKFPEREFGRLAEAALQQSTDLLTGVADGASEADAVEEMGIPDEPEPSTQRASLSGDLEVFGLPGLLQSLEQSESTGRLVLRTPAGEERARLDLVAGRFAQCAFGPLSGESAFYQIFEVPSPGTFEFSRRSMTEGPNGARMPLMGLLMEAMRRFDEFQRLRVLLPDHALVNVGESRPTAPAEESDGELVRRTWTQVRRGSTVLECEAASVVDSYRARSLLAHWLEEGAIQVDLGPGRAGSADVPFGSAGG